MQKSLRESFQVCSLCPPTFEVTDQFLSHSPRSQPHAHNLDGFFVAKLKVSPRVKTSKNESIKESDDEEAITAIEDDEASDSDSDSGEKTKKKGPFDDAEDEEIMKKSREKMDKRRNRNAKGKGKAEKEEEK